MTMRFIHSLCFLFFLALPAGARQKTGKGVVSETTPLLTLAQQRRFDYFYLEGIKQRVTGEYSRAYYCFERALEIYPQSADVQYELGIINYYALNRDSLALKQLKHASMAQPKNPYYLETWAKICLEREDQTGATEALEQIVSLQPKRSDVLIALVELYGRQNEGKLALNALNQIELLEGSSEELSLRKFVLLRSMKKQKQAYQEMENLRQANPHDQNIPLLMASLYLEDGQQRKALQLMDEVRRQNPHYPQLHLTMMDYYEKTGQDSLALRLCDSLVMAPNVETSTRLKLVGNRMQQLAQQDDSLQSAMRYFRSVTARYPEPEMYVLSVTFLRQYDAPQDSLTAELERLVDVDPSNDGALELLLSFYFAKEDLDRAEEICRKGINASPDNLEYSYYLGAIQFQHGNRSGALEILQSGVERANPDTQKALLSDAWSLAGDCYYQLGHPEQAFAAYDSCLVYNPQNVMCLNNYAYYLSLRQQQLDKAEQMSYLAIQKEPLNKTYLDTYAWVLFVNGNASMAKFYIDRVVSPSASDDDLLEAEQPSAEVLEHAAAIYETNDLTEAAQRYRQLAQRKEQMEKEKKLEEEREQEEKKNKEENNEKSEDENQ